MLFRAYPNFRDLMLAMGRVAYEIETFNYLFIRIRDKFAKLTSSSVVRFM